MVQHVLLLLSEPKLEVELLLLLCSQFPSSVCVVGLGSLSGGSRCPMDLTVTSGSPVPSS